MMTALTRQDVALGHEMQKLGRCAHLAPDRNWSGSSRTCENARRPLRVKEVVLADGTSAFARMGRLRMCCSGFAWFFLMRRLTWWSPVIDPVPNFGHDVTYSGTCLLLPWRPSSGKHPVSLFHRVRRNPSGPVELLCCCARIAIRIVEKAVSTAPSNRITCSM